MTSLQHGGRPGPLAQVVGRPGGLAAHGRALPITVAAGLAMGVFGGLVVVHGTGDDGAVAAAGAGGAGGAGAADRSGAGSGPAHPVQDRDAGAGETADSSQALAAARDAAPAAPAAADAAPAHPTRAHIVFDTSPPEASVEVNGALVPAGGLDVPLGGSGRARLAVRVKAHGYKDATKTFTVTGDQTLTIELHRIHHTASHPHTGPGGLIQLE